ncbi:MAG TPA: cation diffusion facilitator family transporter [Amaricoccus sp.]|jgi:cobalt-zinc-cadmium efflux system protein|uniref:cation diffusion facilitator family transporter n=1 Tax=Amaricoccus sp. TaxID=1872485 RepID=UPI002B6C9FA3|nr:cation diffusion facilitator family transporter [Amaricoccus sp.]HMQ92176.1 cation diffusion facilitator family transporter [Amaricoccus sp.]HMR36554.1 cation diffusion facilitator family transporter [Paracoccus sp. (in: a-proteobacteria)]HMR53454.1 cation diffusion facilitator family transporter [Amaricoccus sp.]HMU00419.1 cation diffusion facilitator family transporter [Amaricoccus sp.]
MSMSHGGHTGHLPASGDRKALVISGWLTGIYFFIELGIGIWTGSVAVISDAFHTFSAVGGVLIALVANRLGERKSSPARTFGYIRAEILGALFNGLFLVAMALLVFWMGAMRLMEPIELATTPMLFAAAGGIATELVALWLLYERQKGNLNMRGAFWHVMQTFVGSFLIIISALVIRFTGFLAIDPLLGMAFGLVLLWASWSILREALHILLQGTPEDLDLEAAIEAIRELDGVTDVHHVHAWSLTSGRNVFSSHVCVDGWQNGERVLKQVTDLLRDRFNVYFSTIQIEEYCLDREDVATEIDIMRPQSETGQVMQPDKPRERWVHHGP